MFYKIKKILLSALVISLCFTTLYSEPGLYTDRHLLIQTSFIEGIETKPILLSNHDKETHKNITPISGSAYELLNRANSSILIITFSLLDQYTIELLNQKASQGIEVQIIIDRLHMPASGSLHSSIKVKTRTLGEGHLHHKVLVVDQSYVWLGSANFSAHGYTDFRNLVIACYDPVMGAVLHQESEFIVSQSPRTALYPLSSDLHSQPIELYILPHNEPKSQKPIETKMNKIAEQKLLELIETAENDIKISIAIWTHKDSARALVKAFQNGVKVEVITENQNEEAIKIIKASGIPVRTVPFIHQKFMFVDNKTLLNGSPNWSMNAFSRNDESFIILYELSPEQVECMNEIWRDLAIH